MELKLMYSLTHIRITAGVLIVPFMELKPGKLSFEDICEEGLNRTFYGIETDYIVDKWGHHAVLIVPFMELKL